LVVIPSLPDNAVAGLGFPHPNVDSGQHGRQQLFGAKAYPSGMLSNCPFQPLVANFLDTRYCVSGRL